MTSIVFLKKELKEIIRTKKIYILPSVFLFFGFLSPLTAKYINEIVKTFAVGFNLTLPEPTYLDAFAQFIKNITGIVVIVILLLFAGIVVEEKVKGSASLALSKPLSRRSFIMSKFIASIAITTFAFLLSVAGFMYYTYLLFPGFPMNNIVLGFFLLWIYFVFIISLSLFASTVTKSYTVSAVIAFSVYVVMSILANLSWTDDFMPVTLANVFSNLLSGYKTFGDIAFTFVFTIFLIAALITGSMELFRRQEV